MQDASWEHLSSFAGWNWVLRLVLLRNTSAKSYLSVSSMNRNGANAEHDTSLEMGLVRG